MKATDIIEIKLDRGPCFGTCPVFHFSASRHAGYHFHGIGYVKPLGEKSGGMPGFLFDRLAELCVEFNVMELENVYPSDIDDMASTTVTVKSKSAVKVIHDEGGPEMPLKLWALSELIEVVMWQVLKEKWS